ncbi:non-ribosomal peptide synthetase, partial [Streptomyces antarcticus]|uniref:non-ribosomal peptide synthetase n=1 Tax=Streptomyces antarcticus TaxID=2996458 RepID=UPI0022AF77D7
STGKPKGVTLTHANVVRLMVTAQEHYAFDGTDVWSMFHSYAFDVSVFEMWGALLHGGTLVVVPRDVTRSPDDFLDLLVEQGVTVLSQTPTAFRSLVSAAAEGDPRVDGLVLRHVVFAGEKLEFPELAPWVERRGLRAPVLVNMYGITETTVHTTFYEVLAGDLERAAGNPVGHPLSDLRVRLLDANGNLVPVGVPGEIHVGGPGVARGYLNRPELTAERFVPDPFGPAGSRLYKSGDLARRRPDGSLDFLGRIDHQVKIRGYRVELGEIEAALAGHPGVRDAVVIAREDTPGDKRLVGYVVPNGAAAPETAELRAFLGKDLPDYMVPAAIVPLERIPLTANGKLDQRALPAPRLAAFNQSEYVAPRTPVEEQVAAVWATALELEQVGVLDSFFDLGGDSIRAVALVGALRSAGFDLSVRDVFDRRTVAELCELLTGRAALTADQLTLVQPFEMISDEDRARLPEGVLDAYPLSQIQTGMVIEMLADEEKNHYHNCSCFRILDDKPFDYEAFRRAGAELVARHDMLRTSVHLTDYSVPMQLVHEHAEVPIGMRDLSHLDAEELQTSLEQFVLDERADAFDLTTPTLMRFHAHVTTGSWWISVTECHPIMEGWSYHSLLMELITTYHRLRDGLEPEPYDRPEVRFADSIAGELASLASDADRDYWRGITGGYEKFTLPTGWTGDTDAPRGKHHVRVVWEDLEPALRALATRARASLKSVMLSAFGKVMSQLTDAKDFHAGLVFDVRPEITGADSVFGMYLNTLPFAFDRMPATWQELVQNTFAREVEAWEHRRHPLPAVQREIGGTQRLIDVFFNYQDFRQVDANLVDDGVGIDDSPTEFPLTISSRVKSIFLTADSWSLTSEHTERIGVMFRAVLEAMAADPAGDARTPLVPEEERARLTGAWAVNPTEPVTRTVYELFEEQAARTPDAVAVVDGDLRLSYAELDARANRLAHGLRSLNVASESVVGVLLDRGADLVVGLLGVWKAGGAYVPMDPAFPAERVAHILADAGAAVFLTQEAYANRAGGEFAGRTLLVDRDRAAVDAQPSSAPARVVDLDRLAYVIYTSGSTGTPKGVLVPHGGLVNHVRWARDELTGAGGGAPLFSSIAFDLVVPNLWAPLVAGQAVHTLPQDLDLGGLGDALAEHAPYAFVKLTPAHLEVLTHQVTPEQARGLAPLLVVAGEALRRSVVRSWQELAPDVALVNEYGPTETSVGTCTWPVPGPSAGALPDVMPIGGPLPGVTMYVLDDRLRPLPTGVTGELYVGGAGVARGYLAHPELTADRFVPDPYGEPGARLYRSGDLVRVLPDGNVDFVGRADGQVKLRGYRVELGEIEAALGDHPGVLETRVVLREDTPGDRRLVAYLVTAAGTAVAPADLSTLLGRTLPDYMVPSAFVELDAIPLNANGKLDSRALPAPGGDAFAHVEFTPPRTPLEERVATVWCEVLGTDRIGVHDSFFDLGGDSIRAVALIGALRGEGFDVSVKDVFEHRTVAGLCERLSGRSALSAQAPAVTAPYELITGEDRKRLPGGVVDAYPLSLVQTGMLVETLADEERNNYHNVNVYRVHDDEPFDFTAFEEAVRVVVSRHEALRTSVALTGYSVPLQLVHGEVEVPTELRDLSGRSEERQRADVLAYVSAERARPFDLSTYAPLLRVAAHVLGDEGWLCTFTQSHAVMDGWSNQLFLVELVRLYKRLRDGQEPEPYERPSVRFADSIAAELAALDSAEDRDYWQDIVTGHSKAVIPAGWHGDRSAPAEVVRAGVRFPDLEESLRVLAKAAKASVKSVLTAAFVKVVGQLTDEPAYHAGLVTHSRLEASGADRLYGTYLNTLPFPADRSARTWRELVRQVSDREIEAWPYRHFPMPAIQRPGAGRLVDIFFSYLDFHRMDFDEAEDGWGFNDAPNEFALTVTALGGILSLRSTSHVLSQEHADRIAGMFRAVLEAMAADADGDARAVYLPQGERELLLATGLAQSPSALVTRTVHEVFEAQVARTPDAVAVVAEGLSLSYAEVDARANRLAHHLRSLGVGPESLVGVCLERGADLIPTLLGVLKSGAAYLPLDPANPVDRIAYIVADAGASVVVTQSSLGSLVESVHGGVTVDLDRDGDTLDGYPATAPEHRSGPDNAIYVIYTSGSTGKPKGVTLTHANVVRLMVTAQEHYAFDGTDVWSMFHSYAFDVSVFEMWGALLHGGTLVVVPRDVTRSPDDFLDLLVEQGVTVLSQTPTAFRSLVSAAAEGDPRVDGLVLRHVVFAGEKLEFPELAPWVERRGLRAPVLVNMYGITETTVHTTFYEVLAGDLETAAANAIGRPLGDLSVHLLDAGGRLVPVGVPGEIHVGGPGVARGYLNRPELTAERFVPDPFGPAGSRLYKSGDLARRRPDGSLDFLGRIDHQVKIRGYRVELGEIEAALAGHPGVRDAVVIAREDTPGDKRLVAYCVPALEADPPTGAELAAHCGGTLPPYMVPAAFVTLDAIPLTANGKLDQRALPAPDQDSLARAAYVAPRTPVEERVAAVWREVLGVELVGAHDGFFDLGGDSIRAVALVGALRAEGLDVSVGDVFKHRTVGALGELLASRGDLATHDRLTEPFELVSEADRARLPEGIADAYPMSQVQTGMVVEMLGGGDAYRSFISYRISDRHAFDEDALRRAARLVVGRHEMLRTSFDLHTYAAPMQLVHNGVEVPVTVHHVPAGAVGDDGDGAPGEALMSLLLTEREAGFDLGAAPLLRIAAYAGPGADGWWLSIARPHAITEGWSHNWLLTELIGAYRGLRDGLEPEPYEAPAVRYADYIAAELASLASPEDSAYWQDVLDTHTPFTLPDGWAPAEGQGESYDLRIPLDDIEDELRALATSLRVSVKSVLLAAHSKVLSQLTEAPAFQVGLVVDARPELLGADRVYGMHLNTVPFAVDRSAATWRELVLQVFDREVDLWPHRRYPFPAMQRDWRGGRLVSIAFNYVDLPRLESARGADDTRAEARFGVSQTEFDITLHCRGNRMNLTTNTAVLSRADGERLRGMYRAVLEAMAADADGDARATYLPAGERERLLAELTDTGREPADLRVPEEFELRAAATPDAPAIVDDVVSLSYEEANARANRLAHHLRELGVGPEVLVGICLERSPELILAVLAVLKAGGAYLPLDPEAPAERLGFMVEDAGTRFLLTSRELLGAVRTGDGITTVLVDEPGDPGGLPASNPEPLTTQDNLAYVIYTSGSTGKPKGAMVRRDGMGNHLLAKIEDLGMGAADSVVQNAPPAFDISVWQMLSPLVLGGRVRVVDAETALDPKGLFGRVADEGISVLEVVPSLLRTALDFWDAGAEAPALPRLRRLVVTGEVLPAELCARWLARYPDIPLVNAYGPTECSDDVTHAVITGEPGAGRVPIGRPVRNTRLHVLDEWLQPVPVGVAGELYVGGAGVGRGYLGRPGLTAERFVPDPYGPAGARLYRTGDLAAWLPDGSQDFLGRIDDQVKVRGHRVELGEIDATFGTHPQVRQAVVVVREERLVGYFTPQDGPPATPEELRDWLARSLPDYMVPSAFVRLDEIPLTPNGKVDKRALPAPGDDAFVRGEYLAPRTPAEQRVAEVWRQALGVERVGVRDGFFDLGGDSIRAVALVGALRAEGIDIAVRDVFEARTVELLVELIAGRAGLTEADQAFTEPFSLISAEDRAKVPADVVDAYPLGRTQLGMLIEMIDSDRNLYHIINTFRVVDDKPLDPAALERAAAVLAARHEVLRTSFRLTGFSTPMQLVHAEAVIPVRIHDVRGLTEAELTAARFALMAQQRAETFEVDRAPLFRILAHDESDEAWWVTFTQSHAITEGWSYHQLLVELLDCYRAIRDGREPDPYEIPRVRYADSVAAELTSLRSEADQAYWRRVTAEHVPTTVPAEWAGESDELLYAEVPFDDLADRLRALAGSVGVSMKSVLLAAHMKVMGQLTDEPAYHAGLVVDTRPEVLGADRVLGMYLNTLPLAVDRSARTWRELVSQVFAREVELWTHRRYPMPVVQHEWGGGRLVNVYFNYIDFHQVDTGTVANETRMTSATNEFDLTVFNRGNRLYVNTSDNVMTRAHTDRLAGMYRAVLEAMAADAEGDARAARLPAGERERLLELATRGGAITPADVQDSVHELFEAQVARTPEAVAVIADGMSLTYAEVDARANRLAHHLRTLGAGPESLVGVCLERGADLIPTLLGVLKSGAAYLPLDPANPADRLAYVLGDAGAAVVVAQSSTLGLIEDAHDGPFVVLDRDREVLAAAPATAPEHRSGPDNAIYVIYTSGSTGKPKGVTLTHANVVRLMVTAQEHYAFDGTDVWSMFHSYAFDVSVFEMWGALLHGGTLVVVPREVTSSPEEFLDLLVEHEVTVLSQTPSAFRSLVAAAADGDRRVKRLSLRAVIFAGEKLEISELRPWTEKLGLGRVALVNMYGITETTVHTTYHRLIKRDLEPGAGNPIGRPLSDLTVHLLDSRGDLVPVGSRGEIHVGGPGVARGYLNRPELTAERFVPDPFGPAGSRLYKSGDLARRRPDGSLEFLGRIDHQVKIRGYRIELGEIEAALAGHPEVRDAVVIAREDTPGDKRLVGYLVPRGETAPDPGDLRAWLGRILPHYMVPAAYETIGKIPLTANGKLDTRALPAPGRSAFARSAYVAPRSPVEERIAAIWRDTLGADRVGVRDGFFDLGGDSIKAVMLVGAMREAGFEVAAREILEHQSIEALGERLSRRGPATAVRPVEPFELLDAADRARVPAGVVDAYPLARTQTGMLVEMLAGEGERSYHRVSSVRVGADEAFSARALRRSLDELTVRHEALRTSVELERFSVPVQLVHAAAEIPLRVVDLGGADAAEQDRELRALVAQESRTPLAHESAPLLRVFVHTAADGSWQLTLTQSHLIMDGWTFSLMRDELLGLYRAFRDGREPAAHERPSVRFADTIAAELTALASEEDRGYWRDIVSTHEKFELPDGWGDAADAEGESGTYQLRIPLQDLADGLEAVGSAAGAPLKSVLLAAHLKVLSRLTRRPRFFSGLVLHVRPEAAGADRVYGTHLNTVPFPADTSARTWRELVRQVFERELGLWAHRHFPMPAIQNELGDGGRLIDVRFSYQDFGDSGSGGPDTGGSTSFARTEFPLGVSTAQGCLVLQLDSRAVSRANGKRLAALYRAVLEAMASDAEGDALSAVLPEEERLRWERWAVNEGSPVVRGALEEFEAQAARTPDVVAVVADGAEISYAGLDADANRIAHHLRGLGVGPESVVGVLLDRGADLPATLLGVWKAGGAYLPLDPSYLGERANGMLLDAGAGTVVTSSTYAASLVGGFAGEVVIVDRDAKAIAARPATSPEVAADLDRLAYVIFTSGSTGRPKGVLVPHRGLANHLRWAVDELATCGDGGAALFSSVAFDLVVPNLWAPLLAGQALHILPADLGELGKELVASAPYSFVKLTPGHLDVLTHQLTAEQAAGLTSVLVVAGEPFTRRTLDAWRELAPSMPVINEYGPTEASVGTSIHPVQGQARADVLPIGKPLPNMILRVLDSRMDPVPVGVTGELYVGGAGVARGYAGRPELTAERFVPDPYGAAGTRLYRTGDLVRTLPDGNVDFLGRIDRQVKLRGFRIELGEIETALAGHPGVEDVRVVLREDVPGEKRLVAYLTGETGETGGTGELEGWLGEQLPAYMVPSAFVPVPAIPLTANGKLDERALPAPDEDARGRREYVEPCTGTERTLAGLWERTLGVERVGTGDSFFDLGGHSILVIRMLAEAGRAGLPVSVFMVYQYLTLGELAAAVDTEAAVAGAVGEGAPEDLPRIPSPARTMAATRVPGVSAALLRGGELVAVEAFGTLTAGGSDPVTPETLFQVGSLSKHLTALGVLRLVDDGTLALDEDVNRYLTSWHVPGGPGDAPVTVRQLLGHLSGLSVNEGKGYPAADAVPTLLDVLHGRAPARNAPVTRELLPGAVFRKANVHYSVLQQAVTDATGEPFAEVLREVLLKPLGMEDSSFDQAFPGTSGRPVAIGHHEDGTPVEGGWLIRPDEAAAGLWTTAADLSRAAQEIRRSHLGRPRALFSRDGVRALLAAGPENAYGLGTVFDAAGRDPRFGHGGSPVGYHALATCGLQSGDGWVVLTNSSAGQEVVRALVNADISAGATADKESHA